MRKDPLVDGQVYHIISRSIADFSIFNKTKDFERALNLIRFFQIENPPTKFSYFIKREGIQKLGFQKYFKSVVGNSEKKVQIIAYCLMPTHIHLILKQLKDHGISRYLNNFLNSYTRYFNTCHNRKGPLWESRFKSVLVKNDEYLLHLTRYIHLNPATAHLVQKPEDWKYSSYRKYLNKNIGDLVNYNDLLEIKTQDYQKFVKDRINYQRQLAKIKKLILEIPD